MDTIGFPGCRPKGKGNWLLALLLWDLVFRVTMSVSYVGVFKSIFTEMLWYQLIVDSGALILMALLIPSYLSREGLASADLGFIPRFRLCDLGWGVAAGGAIWLLHHNFLGLAKLLAPGTPVNMGMTGGLAEIAGPCDRMGMLYGSCVLASVLEETVNRGCLITALRCRWGSGPGKMHLYAAISGLVFAVVHPLGHPLYYVGYFMTGALFAYVLLLTRSLNAAIWAHAMVNFMSLSSLLNLKG